MSKREKEGRGKSERAKSGRLLLCCQLEEGEQRVGEYVRDLLIFIDGRTRDRRRQVGKEKEGDVFPGAIVLSLPASFYGPHAILKERRANALII